MLKILIHSNAPWAATGYGQQTAQLAPHFARMGHDVAISAFYGNRGAVIGWEGIKVYPEGLHPYGNDILLKHAADHFGGDIRGGWVIPLMDVWVLDAAQLTRAHVANWTPVDHEPPPPLVSQYFDLSGAMPVAMSRFGERMLAEYDPLYAPHGIDTEVMCPHDRAAARKLAGVPETAFLVGMVAANKGYPPRKGWPEALQAFAIFRERHPEAMLYLHTEPYGLVQGVNLPQIAASLGIPDGAVRYSDPYRAYVGIPPGAVADIYSACDVFLNPAYGEGFGLPIVEAQACGCPVIVADWTAMPELCGAGWTVAGQRMWSPQGSWWLVPLVGGIVHALEQAYDSCGGLRGKARDFALQYDHRTVADTYWQPVLARLEAMLERPELPDVVTFPAATE